MLDIFKRCPRCGCDFIPEPIDPDDDESPLSNMCYDCTEDAIEEADERRRDRIARDNEY